MDKFTKPIPSVYFLHFHGVTFAELLIYFYTKMRSHQQKQAITRLSGL